MSSLQSSIPKLRFLEFSDEWKEFKIEEILKIGSGRDYKHLENGTIPVYGTGGYMTSVNKYLYDGESVCIGRKGTIDKPVYLNEKFWTVDTLFYTHSFNESEPKFIYSIFQNINWKKYSEASGVPSLSKSTIEKIVISKPQLQEQQKIASFLTAVDKKISQLKSKKALLQDYKKGVMQKIFSQELRFKDDYGNAYPDWEEKKLGEVVEKISSGKTKPKLEGKFNVYGSTGIIGKANEYSHSGNFLLIARVGANAGTINSVEGKFGVTDNTLVVQTKEGLNINYLKYFLIKFNLKRLIFGSGQPLITGGQLKSLKLIFPTLKEQTKISNFLGAIDKKIELVNTQLENTQQFKKGLLQQMFV